jgi:hypothetical protein
LLEIVGAELPDCAGEEEDPLQAQVLWYAAGRMVKLQKMGRFSRLLGEYPQLAVRLCMRAGNGVGVQQVMVGGGEEKRFRPESTAC